MRESGPVDEEQTSQEGDYELTEMRLEFTGSAREYFRVWIVNTCLTLFTLGIFSAWAKVRTKRYFYSHTRLAKTPFQYLGRPLPILKGRILGVLLLGCWYAVDLLPILRGFVLGAALLVLPWIVQSSLSFRARYSAYRNMTFHFGGTYGGLAKALYLRGVLASLSCGLAYPWFRQRLSQYVISRFSFGGVAAKLRGNYRPFVKPYLVAALCGGLSLVVMAAILGSGHRTSSLSTKTTALGVVGYAVYFVIFVYLRAELTNVVWNRTELGSVSFRSTLSFRSLLWIYASNTLAVLASAGLLLPWALVRVAKYRVANLSVWASGSAAQFEGREASNVRAAGAETSELFDLDIAL